MAKHYQCKALVPMENTKFRDRPLCVLASQHLGPHVPEIDSKPQNSSPGLQFHELSICIPPPSNDEELLVESYVILTAVRYGEHRALTRTTIIAIDKILPKLRKRVGNKVGS